MQLYFSKYHGTGNDFILIDETIKHNDLSPQQIAYLCNRNFGIGADGLMQLRLKADYDFEMVYYNSDGKPSSMCGNGGRCISQFAKDLGLIDQQARFIAIDGEHISIFNGLEIELKMINTGQPVMEDKGYVLNTGSPHYIQFVAHVKAMDVYNFGKTIRNSDRFLSEGINVNFLEIEAEGQIFVRTYERGVENETLSCGTGVTAAALTYAAVKEKAIHLVKVNTRGGALSVKFEKQADGFQAVWLCGPAKKVFDGQIFLS